MPNQTLKVLLEEIKTHQGLVSKDISEIEPRFQPAWQAQKGQAQKLLDDSKTKYGQEIDNVSCFFFVFGHEKDANRFGDLSANFADADWINTHDLNEHLLAKSNLTLTGRDIANVDELASLGQELNKIRNKMGLKNSFNLNPGMYQGIVTKEDKQALVQRFIDSNTDANFWHTYLQIQYKLKALDTNFTGVILPVVVTGLSEEVVNMLVQTREFQNYYIVKLKDTKVVDKATVLATFKQVKDKMNEDKKSLEVTTQTETTNKD